MINTICYSLFLIGAIGLTVQLLLGGLHIGHSGRGGHAGHDGHTGHSGHVGHNSHSGLAALSGMRGGGRVAGGGRGARGGRTGSGRPQPMMILLNLLSPMTLFSFCLGAGATGLILHNLHIAPGIIGPAAIVAGLIFYALIIQPLSHLVMQFASTPSTALEGAISHDAEVLTRFNEAGEGLVRVTVDGQLVRILARLDAGDMAGSSEIAPGDTLVVTSVDGRSNTCRVARL